MSKIRKPYPDAVRNVLIILILVIIVRLEFRI